MSDSEIREASKQHWGASADSWARGAEEEEKGVAAATSAWMLEAAALQEGERVLELACGAGRIGLQAASRVGPAGSVLCTDFSEAMVEAVSGRVARLEVGNVATRRLDAEHLDLGDEEDFDTVLCRFGYMLMADPVQAMRESARVLRPGGRLVLGVWGAAERNPWLAIILNAVMAHLEAPPPGPEDPGPFALGLQSRLQEVIGQAGFAEVEIAEIEAEERYDSLDAWWEQNIDGSGPLSAVLEALPAAGQSAIRSAASADAEAFLVGDGSLVFPAMVLGARATKPA